MFSSRLFHNSAALLVKVLCLVAVLLYLIKSLCSQWRVLSVFVLVKNVSQSISTSPFTIFQRWYKVNVHKPVIIAMVYNLISQSSFVALLWIFSIEMDCLFSYMPTACRFYKVVVQCALVILTVPPFTTLSGIIGSAFELLLKCTKGN